MASIGPNKIRGNTYYRLSIKMDNKRVFVGIGRKKPTARATGKILTVVGKLEESYSYGLPPDSDTLSDFRSLPADLQDRLTEIGLIERVEKVGLFAFLDGYVERKKHRVKASTLTKEMQTVRKLKFAFGDALLDSIDLTAAEDFKIGLLDDGLSTATVSRHVVACRTIFNDAVRRGMIENNVWKDVPAGSQRGEITILPTSVMDALVDGMADVEWKCLVATYRYLGCRRSEALLLKWADIDWENHRIKITSPKTEGHDGGESRIVPLFPELKPYLDALWDITPDGTEFVFNDGLNNSNRSGEDVKNVGALLRKRAAKIGIEITWKPIQAFRQTRENELIRRPDLQPKAVHAWIGHDAKTAADHYLDVTDEDFDKGAGITREPPSVVHPVAQNSTELSDLCTNWHSEEIEKYLIPAVSASFRSAAKEGLGPLGLEPRTNEL